MKGNGRLGLVDALHCWGDAQTADHNHVHPALTQAGDEQSCRKLFRYFPHEQSF